MKVICKRYIIWSKSIVDIKVSNTEKSKNNFEKCMKGGPLALFQFKKRWCAKSNNIGIYYMKPYVLNKNNTVKE